MKDFIVVYRSKSEAVGEKHYRLVSAPSKEDAINTLKEQLKEQGITHFSYLNAHQKLIHEGSLIAKYKEYLERDILDGSLIPRQVLDYETWKEKQK